jgi:tetratricopeptide (TPR) repeat protein
MPSDVILSDLYYKVGSFLEDMGKYDGALSIYLEARFLYDKASQPINVARAECAVAHIYHLKGAYKQAQQLFKDALERFKKEKGKRIPARGKQSTTGGTDMVLLLRVLRRGRSGCGVDAPPAGRAFDRLQQLR